MRPASHLPLIQTGQTRRRDSRVNKPTLIHHIQARTDIDTRTVTRVLQALGIVVSTELQANETVTLPLLGRLVPMESAGGGRKKKRIAAFEASPSLRSKLSNPITRLRMVHSR